MKEGAQAMLATLAAMIREHRRSYVFTESKLALYAAKETHSALEYQEELFRSMSFRTASMSERMQNIINLVRSYSRQRGAGREDLVRGAHMPTLCPSRLQSFNLVTQRDSAVMLNDSNLMKMVAAATLLFLPITTLAVSTSRTKFSHF